MQYQLLISDQLPLRWIGHVRGLGFFSYRDYFL